MIWIHLRVLDGLSTAECLLQLLDTFGFFWNLLEFNHVNSSAEVCQNGEA